MKVVEVYKSCYNLGHELMLLERFPRGMDFICITCGEQGQLA